MKKTLIINTLGLIITFFSVSTSFILGQNVAYTPLFSNSTFQKTINVALPVGTIGASGNASNGSANYSIPISVPSGTNGITPSLSLVYNSLGGNSNGDLGVGWSIQGLSMISRVRNTGYFEGKVEPVTLTNSDYFSLDGEILISKCCGYGANLSKYGKESEDFGTITSYGLFGGGPDYFINEAKDGTRYEYDRTSNSQFLSHDLTKVLFWRLNRIIYRDGNYIDFVYTNQNSENNIKEINYTGNLNTGLATFNKISFLYGTRDDANTTYEVGTAIKNTKLLTNIVITTEGNVSFKQYELKYGKNNTTSYLKEIVEKGSDGSSLNSTIFKYGEEPINFSTSTSTVGQNTNQHYLNGDVNGDGYSDFIGLNNSLVNNILYTQSFTIYEKNPSELNTDFTAVYTQNLPPNTFEVFVPREWGLFKIRQAQGPNHSRSSGDWDGDGRSDLLLTKTHGTGINRFMDEFRIYKSPNYSTPNIIAPHSGNGYRVHESGKYFLVGDFNGDTRTDILTMLSWNGNDYNNSIYYGGANEWVNANTEGPVFFGEFSWPSCDEIHVIDFNGDGKDDIMLIKDGNCEIVSFSGNNSKRIYFAGFPTKWHQLFFGDFNGDGKTDILTRTGKDNIYSPWYKSISTGTGWIETPFSFNKVPNTNKHYFNDQLLISDYNNDGKSDIAHCWNYWDGPTRKSKIDMYFSKGNNFFNEQYLFGNAIIEDPSFIFTFDSNGDGRPEILNSQHFSQPKQLLYVKKEGKENLLHGIKNGVDYDMEFSYKRMTQTPNFYNRGSITNFPVNNAQMPMYLVSEMKLENGIGGFTTTSFNYEEAKFHREGKGFLGFKIIKNSNSLTGIRTESENEFNLNYFVALPKKVSKFLILNNSLLNEHTNYNELVPVGYLKRFWSRINSTYEKKVFEGQFVSSELIYDSFGNITSSTSYINNTAATFLYPIEAKVITSSYNNNGLLIPHKLTSETITITRKDQQPYSVTNSFAYNSIGKLISKTDFTGLPKQITTTFGYNNLGNQISTSISPSGIATMTSSKIFDTKGRFVISTTNPLNQTSTFVNDVRWGTPISTTDLKGITFTNTYDAFGRLLSTTNTQKGVTVSTNYAWDINTLTGTIHKKTTTDPGRPDEILWYDVMDRVKRKDVQVFGNTWSTQNTSYDIRGNISSSTLPFKTGEQVFTSTNLYDIYNRLSSTSNLIGTTTYAYAYNSGNLITTITNPGNQVKSSITDPAGKTINVTDNGGTLNYTYYSHGKLKEVLQGSLVLTFMNYDEYARQTQLIDANAGTTNYSTDALGQVKTMITPTNQTIVYDYDLIGRKTLYQRPEGITTYSYYSTGSGGATNEVNTITNYGGITEQFYYDLFGRLATKTETVDGIGHITSFTYNVYDNILSQTYPSGFVCNYNYDSNGFLNNIKNGNNTITLYTQTSTNGLGNTTGFTMGNGKASSVNLYFGTPTNFTTAGIQNLSLNWNYQTGNLISRNDAIKGKTENFTYDNLNRLISASGTGLTNITNTYSSNGNISSKTDIGNYLYASSKINAVTEVTNGNSTIPSTPQDILYTSYYQPSNIFEGINKINFTYAANDQRIKAVRQQNNIVVNTRYYFGNYEKDITSGTTRHIHYISSPSGLACIVERIGSSDSYHYAYTDHLGSILTLTNSSGIIEFEQNFDAWGRNRNASTWSYSNILTPPTWLYRGFTGHEHLPEFRLINMNGRLYDPLVGRMLSPDNNIQMPDNTQNFNRYSYALNNPLKYTDPNGEELVTLAVVGTAMLISAATYTTVHFVSNDFSFDSWNWGAFAGAVIAGGIGGFVAPALTSAGIGGFANGALTGISSGTLGSLTEGLINQERGTDLWKKVGKGAFFGGLIGGVVSGVGASIKGNDFWDGTSDVYQKLAEDVGLNHNMQDGIMNCTCQAGESATSAQGSMVEEAKIRAHFGGDKDLKPLEDAYVMRYAANEAGLVLKESNTLASLNIHQGIRNGSSVVVTVPGNSNVAHQINIKGVYVKRTFRVNGTLKSTSINFKVYNPAITSPYYETVNWMNNNAINVFQFSR
jgi:RHS repeat-associated protein